MPHTNPKRKEDRRRPINNPGSGNSWAVHGALKEQYRSRAGLEYAPVVPRRNFAGIMRHILIAPVAPSGAVA
jgi:hypothetical protein